MYSAEPAPDPLSRPRRLAEFMTKAPNPFRWFDSSPEVIRLVVMMYVRYPLSLRNVDGPGRPEELRDDILPG